MTTMIIIAIATALFTVGGIVILAKQRLRSSELKKTIDSPHWNRKLKLWKIP